MDTIYVTGGTYHEMVGLGPKALTIKGVDGVCVIDGGGGLNAHTSPGIDAGDPTIEPFNEPVPNGSRVNMGAHGNTVQASRSASDWQYRFDSNQDGRIDLLDFVRFAENWGGGMPSR